MGAIRDYLSSGHRGFHMALIGDDRAMMLHLVDVLEGVAHGHIGTINEWYLKNEANGVVVFSGVAHQCNKDVSKASLVVDWMTEKKATGILLFTRDEYRYMVENHPAIVNRIYRIEHV